MRVFQIQNSSPRIASVLALVGFIGLCLLVGVSGASLTQEAMRGWYLTLAMPVGTPPNWVFAPVWTTLYVLIGTAGWLIWRLPAHMTLAKKDALRLWGWQLLANALWTPAFFGLHSPLLGVMIILPMLALIVLTLARFAALRPVAAVLMLPYLLWSCYATYLNLGLWWLNRGGI